MGLYTILCSKVSACDGNQLQNFYMTKVEKREDGTEEVHHGMEKGVIGQEERAYMDSVMKIIPQHLECGSHYTSSGNGEMRMTVL